jgi:hypothetical protein
MRVPTAGLAATKERGRVTSDEREQGDRLQVIGDRGHVTGNGLLETEVTSQKSGVRRLNSESVTLEGRDERQVTRNRKLPRARPSLRGSGGRRGARSPAAGWGEDVNKWDSIFN